MLFRNGMHFLSGLPRSGSTLLSALLRQNPAFHAGMSGPLLPIISEMTLALGRNNEFSTMIEESQKKRVLEAIFGAFYGDLRESRVIFDTHRLWTAYLPLLSRILDRYWCFCCVRNVAWTMDSFERIVRSNPLAASKLFPPETNPNLHGRVEYMMSPKGQIGRAWNALNEAFYGEDARKLVLIRYETLVRSPLDVLRRIYDLLGVPWFEHRIDAVEFDAAEIDRALGLPGLHRVRPTVEHVERATILPPPLFSRLSSLSFWDEGSPRGATVW
jgi:sulfotransferase